MFFNLSNNNDKKKKHKTFPPCILHTKKVLKLSTMHFAHQKSEDSVLFTKKKYEISNNNNKKKKMREIQ